MSVITAPPLYPDTRVWVDCADCGIRFKRPAWAHEHPPTCRVCGGPTMYENDGSEAIYGLSGVELVAQLWGGVPYVGTRQINFDRTVEDPPQRPVGDPWAGQRENQVIQLTTNEILIYANRLLGLIGYAPVPRKEWEP